MDNESPLYVDHEKFRKVERIEVKRCFVAAQYFRKYDIGNKRYLPELSREEFEDRLRASKQYVLQLSEKELDKFIADEYKKRLKAYDSADWYIGVISPDEVGVWKGAGGLPIEWTKGSLKETADKVIHALENEGNSEIAKRAKRAIPRIRKNLDLIESDPYLYPIILPGGTMGRKGLTLMKGDIDDGCMRAITLAISGRTSLHAYIGVKRDSR